MVTEPSCEFCLLKVIVFTRAIGTFGFSNIVREGDG